MKQNIWPILSGFMIIGIGLGMFFKQLELFTIVGILIGVVFIYIMKTKVNK